MAQLEAELSRFLEDSKKTQEAIAIEAGVSQASVSRASRVTGRTRHTKVLLKLCIYAKIDIEAPVVKARTAGRRALMTAVLEAWDGTEEHATGLVRVISEIRKLAHRT